MAHKDPEQRRAYQAKWRAENPEYMRQWRAENLDRSRDRLRRWRAENPDKVKIYRHRSEAKRTAEDRERVARWIKANPDRMRELRRKSSLKRRAVLARVPYEDIHAPDVFGRDEWICGLCGDPIDATLRYPDPLSASVDHVVPINCGGSHTHDNVQASHLRCNLKKGARLAI